LLSATPPRPLCRRSELVHRFKVRLGCDVGEGVGRSQSVIVVRDDLGVLEIFANQFESKAETAHAICGLAQKWQIGLEGIIFDGNGNTGRDILRALERPYPHGLEPFFGSRPGERWYTNLRTACAAAWNPPGTLQPCTLD